MDRKQTARTMRKECSSDVSSRSFGGALRHIQKAAARETIEHVATYIKSRLQNEILTASIAQEIEEDGNKKQEAERKRRTLMKKQGERRKGEEGRS